MVFYFWPIFLAKTIIAKLIRIITKKLESQKFVQSNGNQERLEFLNSDASVVTYQG